MTKRLSILAAVLVFAVLSLAACSADGGKSAGSGELPKAAAGDPQVPEATPPSKEEQARINSAIQKMKEEGVLDENGQPAPGVDLKDYPGLG